MPDRPLVAFLRGINVGRRRLKMDRLREIFETLGFRDARTYIASGNVIFDAAADDLGALESGIEEGLGDALGWEVDTFIRSGDEMLALDRLDPFGDVEWTPEDRTHVLFLRSRPRDDAAERIGALLPEGDELRILNREVYWLRRGPLSLASLATFDHLREAAGTSGTMRSLNTVRRLTARFFA